MDEPPGWVTLTEGEEVVWSGPPSLVPYLLGMVVPAASLLAGLVVLVVPVGALVPGSAFQVPATLQLAAAGFLVLAGLVGVAFELIAWYSHRYLITTDEVYHKYGLVSRTVTNLRVDRIETTNFTQSVLGRLLSYGTVHVTTAGTDAAEIVFPKVNDPAAVVERITRLLDET